jgi:hypothetical protein
MKPRGPIAPRGPQVPPAPSARQRAWSALAPGPDPPFGLWGRSIPTGLTRHTVVVQLPHEPAARLPAPSSRATARRVELITITGIGDHLRPEWLITFTGIRKLSSNVVDGGASGGVLEVGLAVDETDAADHLAEAGRTVQPAPATLRALAQAEHHGERRPT